MEEKNPGESSAPGGSGLSAAATDDFSDLDIQRLAPGEIREVSELRRLAEGMSGDAGALVEPAAKAWAEALLPQLSLATDEADATEFARTYTSYQLSATSGTRTYNVDVRVDDEFDNLRESIRDRAQTMLDRAVRDQTSRFVARATAVGLDEDWRRPAGRAFPHTLSYLKPAPTTKQGIYAEEAAVVTAAVHFALSSRAIRLDINQYSKAPRITLRGGRAWSCGFADVNSYNSDRSLVINLNERAIREAGFSDDFWASTIAHEILHTLGWGHPKGSYPDDLPIEIWQWCIETGEGNLVERPEGLFPIR